MFLKKAYPDLKKAVQLEKVQKLKNEVKNDSTKFEETLSSMQKKTHCRESKQLSFWSNMKPKPTKEPSKQPKILVKHHHHPVRVGVRVSQLLIFYFFFL